VALFNGISNASGWNAQAQRNLVHAQAERLHEFRAKNFSGMGMRFFCLPFCKLLLVIHDFEIERFVVAPGKAKAPLVVDAMLNWSRRSPSAVPIDCQVTQPKCVDWVPHRRMSGLRRAWRSIDLNLRTLSRRNRRSVSGQAKRSDRKVTVKQ
jgi:hypothetical protein